MLTFACVCHAAYSEHDFFSIFCIRGIEMTPNPIGANNSTPPDDLEVAAQIMIT
jgi:hypothetical protein